MLKFLLPLVVLVFLTLLGHTGSEVIIDNFSELPPLTVEELKLARFSAVGSTATKSYTGPVANIIGGERDVKLRRSSGLSEISAVSGQVVAPGSYPDSFGFAFSVSAGSSGVLTISWDGTDNADALNFAGLNNYDLTSGGTVDTLTVALIANDLDGDLKFTFYTSATEKLEASVRIRSFAQVPGVVVTYSFPFSQFVGNGRLTAVNAITLEIDSLGDSIDAIINYIKADSLLVATKTAAISDVNGDTMANSGEEIEYTVNIINKADDSDFSATNVVFTDDIDPVMASLIPNSVTTTAGTINSGNAAGNTQVKVTIPTIEDGVTVTIKFKVRVSEMDCVSKPFPNQGHISNSAGGNFPTDDPSTSVVNDPTTVTVKGKESLTITGIDLPSSVAPGATTICRYRYCNSGAAGSATNVKVVTSVPNHATFKKSASTSGWSCPDGSGSSTSCTFTEATRAAGTCGVVDFALDITAPLPCSGESFVCEAQMLSDCSSASTNNTVSIVGSSELSIHKAARIVSASPNQVVIFDLAFQNAGSSSVPSALITETVPAHSVFSAADSTPGWSCPDGSAAGTVCTLTTPALAGRGGTGEATFAVKVASVLDCHVDSMSNTATISGTCDSPSGTKSGTTELPLVANVALSMTKDGDLMAAAPGDSIVYTITFENDGNRQAPNGLLKETVPLYTSFDSSKSSPGWSCPNGSPAGTSCTKSVGTIESGAPARSVQFAVRIVSELPPEAQSLENKVDLTTDCDGVASADETTELLGSPDLKIEKTDFDVTVFPGSTISYRLTVSNIGMRTATGVVITENIPTGTTFNAAVSSAGWECPGSSCVMRVGTLASGVENQYIFAVDMPAEMDCHPPDVKNVATVSHDSAASGADIDITNNADDETTPVQAQPIFKISEVANPSTVEACSSVTFYIEYENTGTACENNAVIMTTVPAFTTKSSEDNWSCGVGSPAGTECRMDVGRLCPGAVHNVTIGVTMDCPVECNMHELTNEVSIMGSCADLETKHASAKATVQGEAVLTILKTDRTADDSSVKGGENIYYDIAYANEGKRNDDNVVLHETIPENTVWDNQGSDARWRCEGPYAGSSCKLELGKLKGGESASVIFSVQLLNPMPAGAKWIKNTASIVGTCDVTPASDDETTKVGGPPDLHLCKKGAVYAIVYTLDYANVGDFDATGVVLKETIPQGSTLNRELSSVGWECDPAGECTFSVGALASSSAGVVKFAITPGDEETCYANTASVHDDGVNGPERDMTNNYDSVKVGVSCPVECPTMPDCPTCPTCPDITCPTCPTCPDITCPTCPDITCPTCPEITCPTCPEIPDITCPTCPTCPDITCPTCPVLPDIKCPTCPDITCPTCPTCPVIDVTCPTCPTCPQCPVWPSMTPCPSVTPAEEMCCPACDSCCMQPEEPKVENQINFNFKGILSGPPPAAPTPKVCCSNARPA